MTVRSIRILLESNELSHGVVELGDSSNQMQNFKEKLLRSMRAKECQERGEHPQKRLHFEAMAPAGDCVRLDCWQLRVRVPVCVLLTALRPRAMSKLH